LEYYGGKLLLLVGKKLASTEKPKWKKSTDEGIYFGCFVWRRWF